VKSKNRKDKLDYDKGNNQQWRVHLQKGKISANYTFDKELICRIYRELKNLTSEKINSSVKRWPIHLNKVLEIRHKNDMSSI
jgi:hypothetical protein